MNNLSPEAGLQLFDVAGSGIRFGAAEDGRPYAVAADFTKVMGYLQSSDATRLLEDNEKGQQIVLTPGGSQKMNVIYEDGLWELIFRSTLPGAKAIKKRVKEILRQIRETGRYVATPAAGAQLHLDREMKDLHLSKGRAEVLAILRQGGVVDAGYLDACGRRLAGRVLGETPEFDPVTKPLTVSMYLDGKNLTTAEIKAIASGFGKELKKLYISLYDEAPPVIDDLVGRHLRPVAQYQERHRPLFDQVYNSLAISSA
ncbi:Bro-N domain-containing protein [Nonomuraea sp. NPDC050790]|uniref:Bro-N domain-containing protein n=1 Tax=Nonomuraea sp. NPDC050790 TaxID=3364371 RepID=UPI00378FCE38